MKAILWTVVLSVGFFSFVGAEASIPSNQSANQSAKPLSNPSTSQSAGPSVNPAAPSSTAALEQILLKKDPEKWAVLKKRGPHVYKDLRSLAFNEQKPLSTRWRAFMAMVRLGEKESLPEVDLALRSRDWFMRDAALKVLPALDEKKAYRAAVEKLYDSALVVRTSAVDALGEVDNAQCADLLWKELYSKENYLHKESLWIRRHIMETLSKLSPPGSEEKFVKALDDADTTLYEPAIKGLERLTGKKLGDDGTPPVYRRFFWKKWFKEGRGTQVLSKPATS